MKFLLKINNNREAYSWDAQSLSNSIRLGYTTGSRITAAINETYFDIF